MLSESTPHLDSSWRGSWRPVRINPSFGLELAEKLEACPNQPLIRTRPGAEAGGLSESTPHSDSTWLRSWRPVRINPSFGLDLARKGETCPNQPLIRTRPGAEGGNLSESTPHSDSTWLGSQKPVRINPSFGLGLARKTGSCPNQLFIRT
jgi:hypothetical protein